MGDPRGEGYTEPGETSAETAVRETKEETGLDVDPVRQVSFVYGIPIERTRTDASGRCITVESAAALSTGHTRATRSSTGGSLTSRGGIKTTARSRGRHSNTGEASAEPDRCGLARFRSEPPSAFAVSVPSAAPTRPPVAAAPPDTPHTERSPRRARPGGESHDPCPRTTAPQSSTRIDFVLDTNIHPSLNVSHR
ncbi:NUDIX domain-containing protein [Halobaculum sp. EA56]|uniref:NUDIX domain-containing protein n=1 Tax=Halobaculum sp. EA56 TaxID=3421648 RepID=UPI003EBD7DB6